MSKRKLDPNFKPWKDLLDMATRAALQSTSITIIQVPSIENGEMAVVHARVQFEDGRVFEDIGDATPSNCNDTTKLALLRMASTRGKARCLRDALNIGEVADVELPTYGAISHQEDNYGPQEARPTPAVSYLHGTMACSNDQCRKQLTKAQHELSTRSYGQALCPTCQKLVQRIGR